VGSGVKENIPVRKKRKAQALETNGTPRTGKNTEGKTGQYQTGGEGINRSPQITIKKTLHDKDLKSWVSSRGPGDKVGAAGVLVRKNRVGGQLCRW